MSLTTNDSILGKRHMVHVIWVVYCGIANVYETVYICTDERVQYKG